MSTAGPEVQSTGRAVRPSFVDPTSPVFWVMLGLSVIGAVVLAVQNLEITIAGGAGSVMALAVWILYGGIIIAVVVGLGRDAERSARSIAGALAWGGLAATAYAQIGINAIDELIGNAMGTSFADANAATISAPIVEGSLIAIGILGLAIIPGARLRTPLDGLFYGVLIGAGFQVVESFLYTVAALETTSDSLATVLGLVFLRGIISGLFLPAAYGGIVGAGIGYFMSRTTSPMWRRLGVSAGAFVAILVFHAAFDLQVIRSVETLVIGAVPLAILLVVLHWARGDAARRPEALAQGG